MYLVLMDFYHPI